MMGNDGGMCQLLVVRGGVVGLAVVVAGMVETAPANQSTGGCLRNHGAGRFISRHSACVTDLHDNFRDTGLRGTPVGLWFRGYPCIYEVPGLTPEPSPNIVFSFSEAVSCENQERCTTWCMYVQTNILRLNNSIKCR